VGHKVDVAFACASRPLQAWSGPPAKRTLLHTRAAHLKLALLDLVGGAHERIPRLRAYHFRDSDFVCYWMDLAQPGRKT
jgi:hypothetical protein